MSLEAFVLGTGGMMPLPGRFLTSVLLRREGDLFLFDCGEGTQVSLRGLNLKWKKITAIFISHTHADHITGLPGILMLSSQVDRVEPLYIIGPPKIREFVELSRRVLDMYINYEIVVQEIENPGQPGEVFRQNGYAVTSFPLRHTKPCVGYAFAEDTRPGVFYPEKALGLGVPRGPLWSRLQAGSPVVSESGQTVQPEDVLGPSRRGRKFSFITDTLFTQSACAYVKDSDILICEGMFAKDLEDSAREKKHMTSQQAAAIAKNSGGIGKMGLIHYSPRYMERDLKQLLREAREIFPDTFLTRDGQVLPMPNPD
ncbi:MAG: ribonuclease Z [Spirochaetales bacterium]|jgi:ribonuclease Z|nr:ribonuclease Z [Spirochaetales bacterium]